MKIEYYPPKAWCPRKWGKTSTSDLRIHAENSIDWPYWTNQWVVNLLLHFSSNYKINERFLNVLINDGHISVDVFAS